MANEQKRAERFVWNPGDIEIVNPAGDGEETTNDVGAAVEARRKRVQEARDRVSKTR